MLAEVNDERIFSRLHGDFHYQSDGVFGKVTAEGLRELHYLNIFDKFYNLEILGTEDEYFFVKITSLEKDLI